MEQHFSNRPTQAQQQQHVYSTSPFSVYSNQPPYLPGAYQPGAQPQQIAYPQAPAQYNRPAVGGSAHSGTMQQQQQRRGGSAGGGNGGLSRGPVPLHQSGIPSGGPPHHPQMQPGGNGAGDAPHSLATAGAPLHTVASLGPHHRALPSQDMPLRIVVDAKYVGAIIGQGGSNIREITKESKARCVVDVQRAVRDPAGNAEKVISILGQPENCTKACVKIMEVVRREMEKDSTALQHPEIELKIRAHNQLVGRLIGKGGATIKKIMEETGAVVFVSNEPALSRDMLGMLPGYGGPPPLYAADMAMHMERTITVKAPEMSIVSAAEQKISQKLRQSYEADLSNRQIIYPPPSAAGAVPLMGPLTPDPTAYIAGAGAAPAALARTSAAASAAAAAVAAAQQQMRTVRMWVPNNMVGALIGAKGVHIRSVMRMTGAHVRIEGGGAANKDKKEKAEGKDNKETSGDEAAKSPGTQSEDTAAMTTPTEPMSPESNTECGEVEKGEKKEETTEKTSSSSASRSSEKEKDRDLHADERLVTITGNEGQQYKAQFWIYQRVAEQSYHYLDEVRLCTEISVPSKLVGRIIGKGGQNVRELQRVTGAQVKIPDDAGEDETQESTTVRVLGNFQASQAVQARLAQLMQEFAHRLSQWSTNGQAPTQGASVSSNDRATAGTAAAQAEGVGRA
uniref:Insulin-like growth factor 2 mRNA-binding protein 1 n=1 Tax=Ascaris suum TaxID=6253 RepID=F1KZW5_ASCSU